MKSTCSRRTSYSRVLFFFFFFQAEDGIRDYKVTGVQTCALPISDTLKYDCTCQVYQTPSKACSSTGTARSSTPTRPTPPLISPCFAKWASRGVLRTLRVTIPQTGTASIAPPNCRALAGTTPTVSGAGTTPSTVRVFWQVCAPCSPAFPGIIYLDW